MRRTISTINFFRILAIRYFFVTFAGLVEVFLLVKYQIFFDSFNPLTVHIDDTLCMDLDIFDYSLTCSAKHLHPRHHFGRNFLNPFDWKSNPLCCSRTKSSVRGLEYMNKKFSFAFLFFHFCIYFLNLWQLNFSLSLKNIANFHVFSHYPFN